MTAPAALYRRYRPDTFQDVIGQEHVTEPLMAALRKNRVNHAYLFSGPRGCGKTTSARILARCLNCEKGPTPEPCGVCPSCVDLARGGAGSLDVIEIDAASHGGVDDARDLRERATFAPVRDRYKIFIIDEAHMVTSAGFNALLKIVEEPPEHIKFIFATTEPDKVIGTIRSRTHHYPFRLVPPEPLLAYLEHLCAAEGVPVAPGVLSLVIRAGGGSVRDSLSVLDQLMAGAGSAGLDYELAVALLGYTHAALLDDVVDAIAAGDSGTVFRAVDRVIQTGHDPRRFVEDLLERFRDLIVVQALPDAAESILRGVPADQLARMRVQAQNLGAAELSRAADVTNEAFNEMTGATSPRLHLELLCARLMLPAADASERGWAARVDRLERRLAFADDGAGPAPAAQAPGRSAPSAVEPRETKPQARPEPPTPTSGAPTPTSQAPTSASQAPTSTAQAPTSMPQAQVPGQTAPSAVEPREAQPQARPEPPAPTSPTPAPTSPAGSGGTGSVEMFRRAWPEILDALAKVKRSSWALVGPNASVAGFDGRTLALAFGTSGLAAAFTRGDHADNLRRAISEIIGVDCAIDAVTGGNGPGTTPTAAAPAGGEQRPKAPADPPQGPSTPSPGPSATPPATPPTAAQPQPAAPSAADVAWGLAPAPAPAPSSPDRSQPSAPEQPVPSAAARTAPARPAAAPLQSPAAQPAQPAAPASAPPRTQTVPEPARAAEPTPYDDIPYSDEEPPHDGDEPFPDDDGYRPSRPSHPAASAAPSAARPASPQAPGPSPSAVPASGQQSAAAARVAVATDPWQFAKESAPGVWSVGAESNVRAAGSVSTVPSAPQTSATQTPASPAPQPAQTQLAQAQPTPVPAEENGRRLSMYERLSRSAAASRPAAPVPAPSVAEPYVEEIPSADDETIEQSNLFGRAAVERILGGKVIEERSLDGSPLPPR